MCNGAINFFLQQYNIFSPFFQLELYLKKKEGITGTKHRDQGFQTKMFTRYQARSVGKPPVYPSNPNPRTPGPSSLQDVNDNDVDDDEVTSFGNQQSNENTNTNGSLPLELNHIRRFLEQDLLRELVQSRKREAELRKLIELEREARKKEEAIAHEAQRVLYELQSRLESNIRSSPSVPALENFHYNHNLTAQETVVNRNYPTMSQLPVSTSSRSYGSDDSNSYFIRQNERHRDASNVAQIIPIEDRQQYEHPKAHRFAGDSGSTMHSRNRDTMGMDMDMEESRNFHPFR